ncbi:uncharacterized protein LOC111725077 [Otolemur garnettii]|uniref:uncharacterized protein LOC111725077 n=1 Tax=Otolemur garnettii TaxID=30611 RepID=UPI000C7F13C3|nr:uncharacterized protein LOC111725077 [Otolemur garnettii]
MPGRRASAEPSALLPQLHSLRLPSAATGKALQAWSPLPSHRPPLASRLAAPVGSGPAHFPGSFDHAPAGSSGVPEPTEGVPVRAAAVGGSPLEAPSRSTTAHADHSALHLRMS